MNREQKLALIIGFAVILVVGVLVSDHLSAAQRVELADATEGDLGRIEARPVALLPDPNEASAQLASQDQPQPPAQREPAGRGLALNEPGTQSRDDVVRIDQGGLSLGEALGRAANDEPVKEDNPRPINHLRDLSSKLAQGLEGGLPVATKLDGPAGQDPEPPAARVREVPEREVVRHTVTKNESLYKIAARYLGDGKRWREIAEANKGKVGADGSVRAGITLVIPNATAPVDRPAKQPSPVRPSTAPTTYTVAKNDSLGEIAQRLLGSVRYMNDIIKANPGKIDDPDDIRVGMVLNIPARS